jgi:ligand-binding sensor domain-containing protein
MVADLFHNASRALRFLSGLLFLLSCAVSSLVRAELLPVKTYTTADGLLRDEVYRIKQDSRGFLWFCTGDGLSRFDGYGFTNYTNNKGISVLFEDDRGVR